MPSLRFNLEEADLDAMSAQGDEAVLCTEIVADLLTPLAAFLQIYEPGGHGFLLESVEGGSSLARYSFMGSEAQRVFRIREGRLTVQETDGKVRTIPGSPLEALRQERRPRRPVPQDELPSLSGGLVGFFSYDLVRLLEKLPDLAEDPVGLPQALLVEYRTVLAFDHLRNRLMLMTAIDLDGGDAERRTSFRSARKHLELLAERMAGPPPAPEAMTAVGLGQPEVSPSEEIFQQQVGAAKRAIMAGDIFQVVLSRRFKRPWSGSPLPVYRRLRSNNPSPYHFLLAFEQDFLAGASPEMLVRVQGEDIHARPIAGTRPRGADPQEDLELERELRADEKEQAEHVMLVDLARNDVGRVSRPGTVKVERFATVERYSHVMHLVSSVSGKLQENCDALDAFAACFPAGTLTGAPKVRAMEIIEASEPVRRGLYGGAVGYWDRTGDLDTCIAIRTVVFSGGEAHVQAGAGIVADSDPVAETLEVDAKARSGLTAVGGTEWGEP
jgi:anthranilate synthase component 1